MANTCKVYFSTLLFLSILASISLAAEVENFHFLKLALPEQKAVVKTPEGKLQVIGVGDVVGRARVTEIAEGRVVLVEESQDGSETIIVRLDGQYQRVERLQKSGGSPPVLAMPAKE